MIRTPFSCVQHACETMATVFPTFALICQKLSDVLTAMVRWRYPLRSDRDLNQSQEPVSTCDHLGQLAFEQSFAVQIIVGFLDHIASNNCTVSTVALDTLSKLQTPTSSSDTCIGTDSMPCVDSKKKRTP